MILDEIAAAKTAEDPQVVSQILLNFYDTINYSLFSPMELGFIKESFIDVFEFLINVAIKSTETNRLMAYRACAFFCAKIIPYFLPVFSEAYIYVLNKGIDDKKGKSILASVFSFIVSYVSIHQSQEFIKKYQFEDLFIDTDPSFGSQVPKIIKKLGKLGLEWHKKLLTSFFNFYKKSQERVYFTSVAAILSLFPEELSPLFLENTNDITFISFVFSTISKFVDGKVLVQISLNSLKEKDVAPASIDSSLQIINNYSGLGVEIKENSILFSFEDIKEEISLEILQKSPYFYLLDLPMDILRILPEDNGVVMQSKLTAIGRKIGKEKEALNVFESFLSKKYSSNTTYYLQALASCIGELQFSNELSFVLQRIAFGKVANWYHATDIISILFNIKTEDFIKFFGKKGEKDIIVIALKYISSTNEMLANQAKNLILKLTTATNVEEIVSLISKNIDYTDNLSVISSLNILNEIIVKYNKKETIIEILTPVFEILFEMFDWIKDDIELFTAALTFIAFFNIEPVDRKIIKPFFIEVVALMTACYRFVTGDKWLPTIPEHNITEKIVAFQNYLVSVNIDITEVPNLETMFAPFVAAVDMIYDFPTTSIGFIFLSEFLMRAYPLFPRRTISYVYKNLELLDDQKGLRTNIVNSISNVSWNFEANVLVSLIDLYEKLVNLGESKIILRIAFTNITASATAFAKVANMVDDDTIVKIARFLNNDSFISKERKERIKSSKEKVLEEKEISENEEQNYLMNLFNGDLTKAGECLNRALVENDLYGVRISLERIEKKEEIPIPFYVFPAAVPLLAKGTHNKSLIDQLLCSETAELNKDAIFDSVLSNERPKKRDVLVLIRYFHIFEKQTEKLLKIFENLVATAETPGRIRVTALFALVFAMQSTTANLEDFQTVYDKLIPLYSSLEDILLCKAFCALIERGCSGETPIINSVNPQIRTIQEKLSIFNYPKTVVYSYSNSPKFIADPLPSNHICGLRLITFISKHLPKENIQDVLQMCLNSIIKNFSRHTLHYQGGSYLTEALTVIFEYKKLSGIFIKNIKNIPPMNTAIFVEIAKTFHLLFNDYPPETEEFSKICLLCDHLFITPPCRDLFESYVLSLKSRVRVTDNGMLRETIVSDPLLYCLRKFNFYDCWWVENMLFEWLQMMEKTVGIIQTISMLTIQFVKYVPRFYTVFIAGMMLLDSIEIGEEEKKKTEELLTEAKLIVKCRAHAAAFILLGKGERRKESIDLAFAPCDTEETDKIALPILESIEL